MNPISRAGSPKVSVHMITYNHERFIKQALASVLMQKVNFEYEVVIGEDCSTDRTREIVLKFRKEHPSKIRLLLSQRNLGANLNFIRTLEACRGQYVALLEGDDYWTSAHKLQKQVDFLDAHPDFSSCFHTVQVIFEGEKMKTRLRPAKARKDVFTLEDILASNVMETCSFMFRNDLTRELPDWFRHIKLLDWPLHILNAQRGKIGFINEVMAAYRMHASGTWSKENIVDRIRESIRMLEYVNAYFGFRHNRTIKATISAWHLRLALEYARSGNTIEARKYTRICTAEYFRYSKFSPLALVVVWLVVSCPRLYRPILYEAVMALGHRISR
jgi:glycosyltransferase involved in cell wall biosynthesis